MEGCGNSSTIYLVLILGAGSIIGFDLVIATKYFFAWTKKRGFQSLKALGILIGILSLLAGLIYAGWSQLPGRTLDFLAGSVAIGLALFPLIDALRQNGENRTRKILLRAPFVVVGMLFCFAFFGWYIGCVFDVFGIWKN